MYRNFLTPLAPMIGLAAVLLSALSSTDQALACSTVAFRAPERPLLAYNFDFEATGAGFVVVNPAGAHKRSVLEDSTATWVARFGSVSFNQVGPGMPAAGMNTSGLVVTLMWNDAAVFGGPETDQRVSELEIIQRLLDMAASVEEAIEEVGTVRIEGLVPIHYFLFDRSGAAAVVTPSPAGPVILTGDALPVSVLTNTSYPDALTHLRRLESSGKSTPAPLSETRGSLERFVRAAEATGDADITVPHAFRTLATLAHAETRWQAVFDPAGGKIDFKLTDSGNTFEFDLARMDYSCRAQPLSKNFREIVAPGPDLDLSPINHAELARSVSEVLSSMKPTAALGRPEIATGIAAGLLAASSCAPQE